MTGDTTTLYNSTPALRGVEHLKSHLLNGASIIADWVGYGTTLNEIKDQYPGDNNAFGKAVVAAGLDVWPDRGSYQVGTTPIHKNVRSAAMWAASLKPEELTAYLAQYPNVEVTVKSGFRGLHTKVINATKLAAQSGGDRKPKIDASMPAGAEAIKAERDALKAELDKQAQIYQEMRERADREIAEAKRAINILKDRIAKLENQRSAPTVPKWKMPKQTFNIILSCLHPDSRISTSEQRLSEAFNAFKNLEGKLAFSNLKRKVS